MKKEVGLSALLAVLICTPVFAGIKDKKAMKASEDTIATAAETVKSACGNAKLDAKIDWSNWEKYDYKALGKEKDEILSYTGELAKSVLESMVELCKDADYKSEIAKITTLNFSGKDDPKEYYVAFSLAGNALNIKLNGDGVGSWKNAELLKAVWE